MSEPLLPPKPPDLGALLRPLVDHGVDFVLIGGMAGIAQGSSYPSYDLDVAYRRDRENISRLVDALREIGVALRGAPADLPFQFDERTIENGANFTFVTEHGDFDVLGDVAGIKSYDQLRSAAQEKEIDDLLVPVASIDHLIAMKRAANRTKDKLMLEEYIVIADERQRAGESDSQA